MDVSSESGPTKRPRAETAKAARKTLTTKKKASSAPPPVAIEMTAEASIDPAGRIATTAFYLAADRNFAPGHELDDWLEAERRVLGGIP